MSSATYVHSDPELVKKSKKSCEKLSENLYIIGNEPTLACYRIQEHVHKSGPMIIDKGSEMRKLTKQLKDCSYGVDYSVKAIKAMESSRPHFSNLQELITNAIFMKQQLDYNENVRLRVKAKEQEGTVPSAGASPRPNTAAGKRTGFQRFSGSFDLPSSLITSSFSGIASSASSDFKDLRKSVMSQLGTSGSPAAHRTRAESLATPSTSKDSEPLPSPPTQEELDDQQ